MNLFVVSLTFRSSLWPRCPSLRVVDALMFLKRLPIRILVSAQSTRFFDFQMNHFDMTFEHNQMFECFTASGALVRSFTHMIDYKEEHIFEPNHDLCLRCKF